MKRLQSCLASGDSIHSSNADSACLKEAAQKFEKKYPINSSMLREASTRAELFPVSSWNMGAWPKGELVTCRNSQHEEAQADYFAVEAFVRSRLKNLDQSKKREAILGAATYLCSGYLAEKRTSQAQNNQHPRYEDRINRLLFAHPQIRAVMGCKDATSPRYCSIEAQD